MKILVIGYPFIKDSFRKTFDHLKDTDVFFAVPKVWITKMGISKFFAPAGNNIFQQNAYFFHSRYPIIGGLLKGWMPGVLKTLLNLRAKKNIDIVFSCSEPTLLTTLYYGICVKALGLKHVIFSWENIPYEQKFKGFNLWLKKLLTRLNLMLSDGLICGTSKSLEIYRKFTSDVLVDVFPMNGFDTERFKRVNLEKKFRNIDLSGKVVFAYVGAIRGQKGVGNILNAFPSVVAKIPNAHLLIVGSGEDDLLIEKQIKDLNLPSCITRISWVDHDELVMLLSVSNVFLYPSLPFEGWEEQFGYSMAEASLLELPVISTKTGSIEEVIIDGETGLLVKPNDPQALAEAMITLGMDLFLSEKMGKSGRQYISEKYSNEKVADKFHHFFSKLLGEFK